MSLDKWLSSKEREREAEAKAQLKAIEATKPAKPPSFSVACWSVRSDHLAPKVAALATEGEVPLCSSLWPASQQRPCRRLGSP